MSSNQNKTTMCNICRKVMRDNNLKLHMNSKHNKLSNTMQYREKGQLHSNVLVEFQHNNEPLGEGCKVQELDDLEVTYTEDIEFELQRDNEVYQKNVDIGEQISISLECENIREKSLSRQIKFCLDLCRPQ